MCPGIHQSDKKIPNMISAQSTILLLPVLAGLHAVRRGMCEIFGKCRRLILRQVQLRSGSVAK